MVAAAVQDAGVPACRDNLFVRAAGLIFAAVLAAVLPGCRATTAVDTIETGVVAAAPETAPPVVGSGPVGVTLFIDAAQAPELAADRRDGAALAIDQLGAGQLTLTISDAGAKGADIAGDVEAAIKSGARFLVGPADVAASPAWTKLDPSRRPPVIVLGPPPGKLPAGAFALVSDETASAAEAAAFAAGAGKRRILVSAPFPLPAADVARLRAAIEARHGTLLGPVVAPPTPQSDADRALLADAEAVLLYGAEPAAGFAALRHAGLDAGIWLLGTSEWRSGAYLEGAYFAAVDQNGFGRIADSFRKTYGRPLSLAAAYAYDAVAVAAGIVRTKGEKGLTAEALRAKAGFKGASGPFRFAEGGRAERRFAIYRVSGGSPRLNDAAPDGF